MKPTNPVCFEIDPDKYSGNYLFFYDPFTYLCDILFFCGKTLSFSLFSIRCNIIYRKIKVVLATVSWVNYIESLIFLALTTGSSKEYLWGYINRSSWTCKKYVTVLGKIFRKGRDWDILRKRMLRGDSIGNINISKTTPYRHK